jgi:hypothetical protein
MTKSSYGKLIQQRGKTAIEYVYAPLTFTPLQYSKIKLRLGHGADSVCQLGGDLDKQM